MRYRLRQNKTSPTTRFIYFLFSLFANIFLSVTRSYTFIYCVIHILLQLNVFFFVYAAIPKHFTVTFCLKYFLPVFFNCSLAYTYSFFIQNFMNILKVWKLCAFFCVWKLIGVINATIKWTLRSKCLIQQGSSYMRCKQN